MKARKIILAVWIGAIVLLLVGSLLVPAAQKTESVQESMRDAVLHSENRISLFGLKNVNPGLISAMTVTALCLRIDPLRLYAFAGVAAGFALYRVSLGALIRRADACARRLRARLKKG